MDESRKQPSIAETIGAVSDAQLHRYNAATLELMDDSLKRWAQELSSPERPVTSSFIQLSFSEIDEPKLLDFFNAVPTSFSLTDELVDKLIRLSTCSSVREKLVGTALKKSSSFGSSISLKLS